MSDARPTRLSSLRRHMRYRSAAIGDCRSVAPMLDCRLTLCRARSASIAGEGRSWTELVVVSRRSARRGGRSPVRTRRRCRPPLQTNHPSAHDGPACNARRPLTPAPARPTIPSRPCPSSPGSTRPSRIECSGHGGHAIRGCDRRSFIGKGLRSNQECRRGAVPDCRWWLTWLDEGRLWVRPWLRLILP